MYDINGLFIFHAQWVSEMGHLSALPETKRQLFLNLSCYIFFLKKNFVTGTVTFFF
jgi:hypothetical protein